MTTTEQTVTYDELLLALDKATDVAIWMSGSSDFSPGGVAHEGWLKMRPELFAALNTLQKAKSGI